MALSQVQKKTYSSTSSSTSHSLTFNSGPTQNNLLIVVLAADDYMASPPAGWTQATSAQDFVGLYILYKVAGAAESSTITVTIGSSTGAVMAGYEYSGAATSSPLDKSASAIDTGTGTSAVTGTTAATTQADEVVIACVGLNQSGFATTVLSWSNSFTTEDNIITTVSVSNVRLVTAIRIVSATAAYSSTATLDNNGTNNDCGSIATFKQLVGGGGGNTATVAWIIA